MTAKQITSPGEALSIQRIGWCVDRLSRHDKSGKLDCFRFARHPGPNVCARTVGRTSGFNAGT